MIEIISDLFPIRWKPMMRASLIIVVALIILLDQVHGQQIQLVAGHVVGSIVS